MPGRVQTSKNISSSESSFELSRWSGRRKVRPHSASINNCFHFATHHRRTHIEIEWRRTVTLRLAWAGPEARQRAAVARGRDGVLATSCGCQGKLEWHPRPGRFKRSFCDLSPGGCPAATAVKLVTVRAVPVPGESLSPQHVASRTLLLEKGRRTIFSCY